MTSLHQRLSETRKEMTDENWSEFSDELQTLINRMSIDSWAETHDFLLAELLTDTLRSLGYFARRRDGLKGYKEQAAQLIEKV